MPDPPPAEICDALKAVDESLGLTLGVAPDAAISDPAAFVQIVVSDGVTVYVPLSGIVDPAKEIARLTKRATKLEKEASGLAGRLKSPKFTEKAPADVVEKSRKELAELEEQLLSVRERMATMEALLVKS